MDFDEYKKLLDHIFDVCKAKNNDYGDSYSELLEEEGLIVAKVHLKEKLKRFETLMYKNSEVGDESIEDTLLDMANYCLMTALWVRGIEKVVNEQ